MIPAIGIMIGCYIIVRMCELLVLHPSRGPFGLVKVFAVGTILVSLLGMADLVFGSVPAAVASLPGSDAVLAAPSSEFAPLLMRPTRARDLRGLTYSEVVDRIGMPEFQVFGELRYTTMTGGTFEVYLEKNRVTRTEPSEFDLRQLRSMQ